MPGCKDKASWELKKDLITSWFRTVNDCIDTIFIEAVFG